MLPAGEGNDLLLVLLPLLAMAAVATFVLNLCGQGTHGGQLAAPTLVPTITTAFVAALCMPMPPPDGQRRRHDRVPVPHSP